MTIEILTIDVVTRNPREAVEKLVARADWFGGMVQADIQTVLVRAHPGDSSAALFDEFVRVRDSKHLRVKIAQLQRREEAA